MAIPDFQSIMLPFLMHVGDGEEHRHRDTIESLARYFQLSPQEMEEKLPSGRQSIFVNRVGWTRTYLMKAGLLEYTRRGYCKITTRGQEVLASKPARLNTAYLRRFPEFDDFHSVKSNDNRRIENSTDTIEERTPGENMEYSYEILRKELASELLKKLKSGSFQFFEKTVVELLVKMGYGGSILDAGQAVGRSGDGGVDGIIKEDRLGLDMIYIQAKRWEGIIGRPEIQKFAGALQGKKARKGVFMTTSGFTREAKEFAGFIDNRIVLIDGEQLTNLMIEYNLGVTTVAVYEEKKIDVDYFSED